MIPFRLLCPAEFTVTVQLVQHDNDEMFVFAIQMALVSVQVQHVTT